MALRLPEPIARSGEIPIGRGWVFEPKLDGFRCLVCTHAVFRARFRRGWDMSHLLPEFRKSVPAGVQLDGELVALAENAGLTSTGSARGCCTAAPGSHELFVFDCSRLRGSRRRCSPTRSGGSTQQLELENQRVRLVATFEDGEALFDAVCERGLEGAPEPRTMQSSWFSLASSAAKPQPLEVDRDESPGGSSELAAASWANSRRSHRSQKAWSLGPVYGPLVLVAAYTGLRPSDWAALEWRGDVHREAGVLTIERALS